LHAGERKAVTAEALMRSRYAAFSLGEADYLIETWHPDKRGGLDRRSLEGDNARMRWVGLTILDVVKGGPGDDTGIVEFEASYKTPTTSGVMRERSRFVREDGAWVDVDGETSEQERPLARAQGRNEPCRCGSGKKAKRCCGA
jgi:SEC-C motif-containing protein